MQFWSMRCFQECIQEEIVMWQMKPFIFSCLFWASVAFCPLVFLFIGNKCFERRQNNWIARWGRRVNGEGEENCKYVLSNDIVMHKNTMDLCSVECVDGTEAPRTDFVLYKSREWVSRACARIGWVGGGVTAGSRRSRIEDVGYDAFAL
jgi:hypothetical protein